MVQHHLTVTVYPLHQEKEKKRSRAYISGTENTLSRADNSKEDRLLLVHQKVYRHRPFHMP